MLEARGTEVVKLGMYVGFTGVITFKNARRAIEAATEVPLNRLLIETDCPYLSPHPLRGKRNDSSLIKYTAKKLAEIKHTTFDEIVRITNENARKVYELV